MAASGPIVNRKVECRRPVRGARTAGILTQYHRVGGFSAMVDLDARAD
jgi:hypothetical protein